MFQHLYLLTKVVTITQWVPMANFLLQMVFQHLYLLTKVVTGKICPSSRRPSFVSTPLPSNEGRDLLEPFKA